MMKTQSPDTSLDAELVLIRMIRKAPMTRRFAFVQSWTASMLEAGSQYMQQLHPQASDEDARLLFIERQYGKELTDKLRQTLHMYAVHIADTSDYWEAICPLVKTCEDLDIPYALSGSLASSLYGMERATLQIDVVADLRQKHLLSFCDHLSPFYLLPREEIGAAIQQQTSFALVHLESLLKVVVTPPRIMALGQPMFHRVREAVLVEREQSIRLLAPEQVIVLLLGAFKRSDEGADDLWYDLLGVLKVQGTDLDMPSLAQQAAALDVTELLE
ncbi:MAG: hypothetical protein AUI36_39095, partial [Cyanobacteria bacterium 13_1_40CM_2_61_4]